MAKPLKPSEQLVGRKLPAEPAYADQLLAGFIKADGALCGRAEPSDSWLKPAFKKLRRHGYVRFGFRIGFGESRRASTGIWYLTEQGEAPAREALARVQASREARDAWGRDLRNALAARKAPDIDKEESGSALEDQPWQP